MDRTCPRCGGTAAATPEGLCPGCLLLGALAAGPPKRMGAYELLEIIGRGGMGVVYRARQVEVGHEVALKLIRGGELASHEEVDRFILEAKAASRLEHPNIVRIYHVAEDDGRPFFTMQLLEGGSLDAHTERLAADPQAAASLVAKIARAVHHGHDRGVLHRDLKPANILLDSAGEPHVGDFGVAKVHGEAGGTITGAIPGTPAYMAPEVAAGWEATRAGDIWSLGAILYELLSGQRPFAGATPAEILRRLQEEQPAPLRALVPALDRDLETICHKCLDSEPSRRYESADDLAEDLERFLRLEPILARPMAAPERLWRWARRYPVLAILAVGVATLMLGLTFAAVSVASAQEEELRRDVLRTNSFAARAEAGTALFQLREVADLLEAAAADPEVMAVLTKADCSTNAGAQVLTRYGTAPSGPFDSIAVFDTAGRAIRRWPAPSEGYLCSDYGWRDYLRGVGGVVERGGRTPYVGRAINSEADGQWKFTLAAPVWGLDGRWLGSVMGTIGTDAALGALRLSDPTAPGRTAVLVGPRDNARDCRDCDLPDEHIVLLHDDIEHGKVMPIDSNAIRELAAEIDSVPEQFVLPPEPLVRTDADHRDPFDPSARWLAGFAPVGMTGYIMIVQTRYDMALGPNVRLSRRLGGVGVAALVGVLLVVVAILRANRRRDRVRGGPLAASPPASSARPVPRGGAARR